MNIHADLPEREAANKQPTEANSRALKPQNRTNPADIDALRQLRDQLFQGAREDPDSEAGQVLRALLLSSVATATRTPAADAIEWEWTETRRSHRLAEEDRARRRAALAESGELDATGPRLPVADSEMRLEKIARLTENAAAAAEAGRPLDAQQVYRRISEIVGLRAPEGSHEVDDSTLR